jgi:D-amino peptidase
MQRDENTSISAHYDGGGQCCRAGGIGGRIQRVLVADSHGDAQNIDIVLLDGRARLIPGWPRPLGMMQGIDDSFSAAVFVGYHASEGTDAPIVALRQPLS